MSRCLYILIQLLNILYYTILFSHAHFLNEGHSRVKVRMWLKRAFTKFNKWEGVPSIWCPQLFPVTALCSKPEPSWGICLRHNIHIHPKLSSSLLFVPWSLFVSLVTCLHSCFSFVVYSCLLVSSASSSAWSYKTISIPVLLTHGTFHLASIITPQQEVFLS